MTTLKQKIAEAINEYMGMHRAADYNDGEELAQAALKAIEPDIKKVVDALEIARGLINGLDRSGCLDTQMIDDAIASLPEEWK